MTDMTLEQMAAKIRSHADFVGSLGGSGELMDSVELSDIADAIDAHLAKAAQPGEAVDVTTFEVTIAEGSPEFINGYLLGESPGESGFWLFHPNGRNYNGPFDDREEALMVARRLEPAAVAHPRPTGSGFTEEDVERCEVAMVKANSSKANNEPDDATFNRACVRSVLQEFTRSATPTGEQAGEVAWIDHTPSGVVLRTLGECERLEDLPHGTKLYAQPRPVGVPDGWEIEEDGKGFVRIASPKCELHIGFMPPPSIEATTMLRDLACALLAAAPDGEVG